MEEPEPKLEPEPELNPELDPEPELEPEPEPELEPKLEPEPELNPELDPEPELEPEPEPELEPKLEPEPEPEPEPELEPGWLLSHEGRRHRDALMHRQRRRLFGLLERPALPPALAADTVAYKLFVSGRSGVGKTALVAALAGAAVPPAHHETLGIQATSVYWAAKARRSGRPLLVRLDLWDCGEAALRKFEHILPACKEEADGVLFLFSFTDRASFEDLPAQMARVLQPDENLLRVVVGTNLAGFDLSPQAAVAERDVAALARAWRVPPLLDALVERLWRRDQAAAGVLPDGHPAAGSPATATAAPPDQ
ncbi:ciliogenesis and planar polarity effector 2 [Eudromia elegans]